MSAGTRFGDVLAAARASERAVGAFTCYDQAGFEAVARAAEASGAPVIVLVSPGSFRARGGELVAEQDLRRAVQGGVAKVNVNTELRAAYFGALESDLSGRAEALDLLALGRGATEAVQEVVQSKLVAFGWTA